MAVDPLAKKMNAMVKDTEHYKRVVLSVQTFNAKRSFADLCFVCARGHKVYAHKLLFCTVSNWLKTMFLEIQDNLQTLVVHLPDIESRMMELLVDFLYEGSVRVNQNEYASFQSIMDTLGIFLTPPETNETRENSTQQTPQLIVQTHQQIPILQQQLQVPQQQMQTPQQQLQSSQGQQQGPQLVYMPSTPNAQGQVQYMLATPSQMNQVQVLQAPLLSPTQQNPGQMVQNRTQVLSSQVQQSNMMQMVQQNNTQMVPMNQLVAGGQMMQCSSQMVMQGNQQNLVSNNQLQVGMQAQVAQTNYNTNQTVQQQPQYVMASNTNQLSNNRTTTQYRSQTRTRPALPSTQIQQQSRMNNEVDDDHTGLVETIKSILQEEAYSEQLTARKIRESLEQRLNKKDLAFMDEEIDCVLKSSYETAEVKHEDLSAVPVSGCSVNGIKESKSPVKLPNRKSKKRRKSTACNSDNESDEDFNPRQVFKKSGGRPKRKNIYQQF